MNELAKRLFDFATRVILFVRTLPDEPEYRVIRYQLVKSAASGGSNYEEAQAG
jgi:four helix bundle protein